MGLRARRAGAGAVVGAPPYMRMYWGDYFRDTGHLNRGEHGAYLMLIKHYWCTGEPLNDDDNELWRISCCDSKAAWLKLRPILIRFFIIEEGKLRHKRVEAELERAGQRSETHRRNGSMGGRPPIRLVDNRKPTG